MELFEHNKDFQLRLKAIGSLVYSAQGRPDDFVKPIIDALIEAMREDKNSWLRGKATEALGELGQGRPDDFVKPIVDALMEVLMNENPWLRGEAAQALGEMIKRRLKDRARGIPGFRASGKKTIADPNGARLVEPDFNEIRREFEKLAGGNNEEE